MHACRHGCSGVQTAEVVQQHMPALPVRTSAELRERSVGTLLQGLTHAEAAVEQPDAYTVLRTGSPDADVPGGGESEDNFYGRARTFLTALADAEAGALPAGLWFRHAHVVCMHGWHACAAASAGHALPTCDCNVAAHVSACACDCMPACRE